MSDTIELSTAVFSKTALAQQEIQTRSLGLSPLVRRILVLADGKRTGADLAAFLSGSDDIDSILRQLMDLGCLEAQARARPAAPSSPSPVAAPVTGSVEAASAEVQGLPPAESRTAKDNEMARNFMINSVNSIIGQNMRISLVHDIFHAENTEQLRKIYHAWSASMADHRMGAKRLPELREKLFKVL